MCYKQSGEVHWVHFRQKIRYCFSLWKIEERSPDSVYWHGFSKIIRINTAYGLFTACDKIARDRQLATVATRAANLNYWLHGWWLSPAVCLWHVSAEDAFPHKFPATNYLWNSGKQQLITIIKRQQQQNATNSNPDPKNVKLQAPYRHNTSCCESSILPQFLPQRI